MTLSFAIDCFEMRPITDLQPYAGDAKAIGAHSWCKQNYKFDRIAAVGFTRHNSTMTAPVKPERKATPAQSDGLRDAQRRLLPHDLERALQYASDEELKELRDAITQEMKRRNLPQQTAPEAPARKEPVKAEQPAHGLTRSQVSLVRASIEAGVKPAVLARQFGISLASIRAVLAQR